MISSYSDHPTEEELERFLLHHAQEDELDRVETHILACDGCVTRLEQLEVQMAAVKLVLSELEQQPAKAPARAPLAFANWFTIRNLSWAGAVALLVIMVSFTPRFLSKPDQGVEVSLLATRGSGVTTIPHGKSLRLHLGAEALQNGPAEVIIVDGNGLEVWRTTAQVRNEHIEVDAPKLDASGSYYLRLYRFSNGKAQADLLREFPFDVS
jgi:hypothetical protein